MIDTYTLTAEDLRALKSASRWVSFHATWRDGELTASRIKGTREDAAGSDYTVAQIILPSYMQYGGSILRADPVVNAYGSCSSPTVNDEWLTVLQILRTGDRLSLAWSANGWRNGHLKAAGLNSDHLELRIDRGKATRLFLHLTHTVSTDDTARMFTGGERAVTPLHGPDDMI